MSENKRVSLDQLGDAISEILEEYREEVNEQIKDDIVEAADDILAGVKQVPAGAEHWRPWDEYSAGWKKTVRIRGYGDITAVIHNPKKYMLTHLLEEGHVNRDGSRAQAFPHVEPAAEAGLGKLEAKLNG